MTKMRYTLNLCHREMTGYMAISRTMVACVHASAFAARNDRS